LADYDLNHIDFGAVLRREAYTSRNSSPRPRTVFDRASHAAKLRRDYAQSFDGAQAAKDGLDLPPGVGRPAGDYIIVEQAPGGTGKVGMPGKGIRAGAQSHQDNGGRKVVLHVPAGRRDILDQIIADYGGAQVPKGENPPGKARVEAIKAFASFALEKMWRDDQARMPSAEAESCWWGVWCWPDCVADIRSIANKLQLTVAPPERQMTFPDAVVVPIHGQRSGIEMLVWASDGGVAELGTWVDDAAVLDTLGRADQSALVHELADRIDWPGDNVPVVCLLDTGVSRGHPLIEPALASADLHALDPAWGVDDHDGHGSAMSGMLLHGDLTSCLNDWSAPVLRHRMESVKLLPPPGTKSHEERNYGAVTQGAVYLVEAARPDRARVVCSAVTARDVAGDHPTLWSTALDQLASGWTEDPAEEPEPRRLIIQAIGNVPAGQHASEEDPANHPGEDPSQAWNVLTVGGVTFRTDITDAGYERWTPRVGAGEASPHSRTSEAWPPKSAVQPDIVFEAGNRADDPAGMPPREALPSMSSVTTARGGTRPWILPFNATSAATAEAARMAAQIMAENPDCWPETVRALMVHSAEWTPAMKARFGPHGTSKTKVAKLRRIFGYGMPRLDRALASARSDLALVTQVEIQPFAKKDGFQEAHYFPLPWPTRQLQQIGDRTVRLKVVLSYFVEPNPSSMGKLDPAAYQSYGLRSDLQRNLESYEDFRRATNRKAGEMTGKRQTDKGWLFGENAISAGSLHVDVWEGPGAVLASRSAIMVKPVGGWWGERRTLGRRERKGRYALVLGLEAPGIDVDLHTPISAALKTSTTVEV
jgi:hypothetical protein